MLFKNKKQINEIKELPVLITSKELRKTLELSRLCIIYSTSQRTPYSAEIKYQERPNDFDNHGAEESTNLTADSWPELIDKVIAHFEGGL